MKQAVTRVEDKEYDLFQETAANIGLCNKSGDGDDTMKRGEIWTL